MNNIVEEDFVPKVAIIVYSQKGEYNEHYLESRTIKKKEGNFQMMNGKPLSKELLAGLLEEVDPKKLEKISCEGFLPKNLLAYNNDNAKANMIWYVKASFRNLSFIKDLGIKDGEMHLPTLIFKCSGNSLSVWAVKTNNITEETKLYKAPFMNVYDDGGICMGSAKVVKSTNVKQLMKNWENAFFQSKFSHLHGTGSPIDGNLTTFVKRQMKGKKLFDKSVLIPTGDVIEDLL